MSKQYNKIEKRHRRKAYLRRKEDAARAKATKAKAPKVEEPAAKG